MYRLSLFDIIDQYSTEIIGIKLLSSNSNVTHNSTYADWRNIMTVISPDEVLTVLLKARDYDTAKQWCKKAELIYR
jgi:hypothetical protein